MNWKTFLGVVWVILGMASTGLIIFAFQARNFLYVCDIGCFVTNPVSILVFFSAVLFFVGAVFSLYRPEIKSKIATFFIFLPLIPFVGIIFLAAWMYLNK